MRGGLLAAATLALSGCVSATSELSAISNDTKAARLQARQDKAGEAMLAAAKGETAAGQASDQQIAINVAAEGRLYPVAAAQPAVQNVMSGQVVMQSAAVTNSSIDASRNPSAINPSAVQVQGQAATVEIAALDGQSPGLPAMVPVPVLNPLKVSPDKAELLPQPSEQGATPTIPSVELAQAPGDYPGAEAARLPLPESRAKDKVALADSGVDTSVKTRSIEPLTDGAENADLQPMPSMQELQQKQKEKKFSLADLFKRKKDPQNFDRNRFGKRNDRDIKVAAIPNMDTGKVMGDGLPGVKANAMFPMTQLPEDEHGEDEAAGLMKLASLPSMMRMGPNGLLMQTERVEARCFRPQLVRMLKHIENHYQRPVIVTSGFRDSRHNRRVGGARGSLHTLCAAADIQVEGVTKWQLAEYLRTIPGRGGVGTYCHTDSVHIDVGEERDWNWRCRRKKRRHS